MKRLIASVFLLAGITWLTLSFISEDNQSTLISNNKTEIVGDFIRYDQEQKLMILKEDGLNIHIVEIPNIKEIEDIKRVRTGKRLSVSLEDGKLVAFDVENGIFTK